ncbi:extracellular solute-binding protein [Denitratisoma oestradiolicum]|uniref:sn-glycerol-3-phosphate-binding periplasmic protein UgpB n=1 Tax=Denitratisoma oestradiolicum TaxID=311182 RepID=A0A6S6XVS9_9PROT|nr:extracellular solute-binding protein [Denitratisoma oestradiolicum]TWO80086.1 hypothetical protein CBW56_10970 [Denitratisoma oestradiolicum]CAB1370079.1 conserved exported protein of unknown function [Denitratisoma oestradiolicum]
MVHMLSNRGWAALAAALVMLVTPVHAQEVVLRHALEGKALDALATLTLRFNDAQKGKARVVLQGLAGVEDKRHLPQMALLDPDDSLTFFDTRPRFRPLHEIMKESREKLDPRRFYPQMADAVDDAAGRLQALPLGLSVPVLFWNKAAFTKAGLDPESPPRTWWEVQKAAGALFDVGSACPFTTSSFAWVHMENLSSQHNEPMLARPNRIAFNSLINVKHLALLSSWYKSRYFRYYGPRREGDAHFLSGECAMLTSQSSLYADIAREGIQAGAAMLPHYDDQYGVMPRNVLPDGAGLWMLAGFKKPEYQVAARFVSFLMRPDNQRAWVRATGYLPMMPEALKALREAGVPAAVADLAERRLSAPKTLRVRMGGGLERLREILGEEMEFVWRNEKPAKEALDTAMRRADGLVAMEAWTPRRR